MKFLLIFLILNKPCGKELLGRPSGSGGKVSGVGTRQVTAGADLVPAVHNWIAAPPAMPALGREFAVATVRSVAAEF